jgi:hypothetical protein
VGPGVPLLLSGAAGVISFLMFDGRVEATGFVVAVVLLQFCWNFAQPLLSGICAEACLRGRVVCAMGSIQTFGTGLGPAAAAATLASGSFAPMIYANSAILAASIAVTVLTIRAERRRRLLDEPWAWAIGGSAARLYFGGVIE